MCGSIKQEDQQSETTEIKTEAPEATQADETQGEGVDVSEDELNAILAAFGLARPESADDNQVNVAAVVEYTKVLQSLADRAQDEGNLNTFVWLLAKTAVESSRQAPLSDTAKAAIYDIFRLGADRETEANEFFTEVYENAQFTTTLKEQHDALNSEDTRSEIERRADEEAEASRRALANA